MSVEHGTVLSEGLYLTFVFLDVCSHCYIYRMFYIGLM